VQLVLVRHGVTEGADGLCMGHADLPLAERGRPALASLAAAWRDDAAAGRASVAAPAQLVASDLARTRSSADILGGAFGLAAALDARLREMHFGRWEGRAWSALEAEDGERLGRWMAEWATEPAPEGEAFPDVAARAAAWLADLRAGPASGGPVLVVAHSGSIRALLCELMGWPLAAAFRVRVDHARATGVRVAPAGDARGSELLFLNADRVPRRA
jgi:broad specificity phosphatase PhoE